MLSRSDEKRIRGLHRRKGREREGLFLAEGIRVVEDLLESDVATRLAVVSPAVEADERGRALVRALEARMPLHRVEGPELDALAATESPQGVLVVAEIPRRELAALEITGAATVLVLDAVQDPGNLGTLIRTAVAFGVAAVAVLPGTVDPWNPKGVRAAAGASFRVPIVEVEPDALLGWLRERGFTLYGAAADGTAIGRVRRASRAALAVGNEGAGLGPTMREAADTLVAVPVSPRVESLNVAVAAGILMYLLTRGD